MSDQYDDAMRSPRGPEAVKREHVKEKCDNPDCGGDCFICTLFVCTVCGCYEGSLATECPGQQVSMDKQDAIYAGSLDYIRDHWVEKAGKQ